MTTTSPAPAAAVCVTLRWLAGVSKNARWKRAARWVYLSPDAQAWQDEAVLLLRQAMRGQRFDPQRKLWIGIHVQKRDHRSDAINVVDAVADAVKLAAGVDDRWYAVATLDWSIVRTVPPVIRVSVAATAAQARRALRA